MTRLYYVNPANTADIQGPYEAGRAMHPTIPDTVIQGPDPANDIYEAIEATCARYFERVTSPPEGGFVGTPKNAAARVQEGCRQWDINRIYQSRLAELQQIAQGVEDQGRTVTGLSEGDKDMPTRDDRRTFYVSFNATSASIPAVTTVKFADLWGTFFGLTKADTATVIDQITLFHDAPRFANADSLNNQMITARDADDAAALIAIDLTAGWPEAPVDPRTKSVGARATRRWDA